uniref:Putative leukocyte receptor cluster (Lrc) member n=1 Tax=Schistosoma mansoni TaxID=6183 RepID=A0A5K4EIQ0_SCHMA
MAQWGSYGSYWQGAYPGYYDYAQPAQTYDYNHQTIPVSSVQDKPSTPPPPGVESTVPKVDGNVTVTSSIPATYDPSWCTSTPFHSPNFACAYTYSPTVPPRQPVMFDPSPQRHMMPNVSYPSYGSPQLPLHMQSQLGCNWNAARPTYGYPVNGGAVQSFGMWPDGRSSVHPNGLAVTGPRFPFQSTLDSPNTVASENTANTPISKEVLQQPPASFQDKGVKEQWSDELKEYVQRAFCSIDTSEEKDQMERILKEKLEYVFRNNIKVDWKTENIPTIPSRAIASFRKSFNIRGNSVNTPQLATRGNSKGRRRRRGGASNADSSTDANTSNEDVTAARGRGRGNWRSKRGSISKHTPPSESRLTQRASRFKDHLVQSPIGSGSIARTTSQLLSNYTDERDDLAVDFGSCQIVGTMQEIEKQYLRLTRAPDPTEVRPLAILKLSLEHVKEKWRSNTDYHWVCEQFKSIRQDLTVQGIEDDFAVSVYEAHADVALEAGDFEEFHQCQSQLLRLHKEGLGVSRLLEFTAYRLLYYIFTLDILGKLIAIRKLLYYPTGAQLFTFRGSAFRGILLVDSVASFILSLKVIKDIFFYKLLSIGSLS